MIISKSRVLPTLSFICLSVFTNSIYAKNSVEVVVNDNQNKQAVSYIRKSVFDPDNKQNITDYNLAVKLMKELPKTDRRNWYFISGIHGYFNPKDFGSEYAVKNKVALTPEDFGLYSKTETKNGTKKTLAYFKDKDGKPTDIQAWDLCHSWGAGSNLFLLWHRVYVYSLEGIARNLLTEHNGKPSEFALPYWDYTDLDSVTPNKKIIPTQFYPNKVTPALYDGNRSPTVYTIGMRRELLDIKPAIKETDMNNFSAKLERGVHGNVHDEIGNPRKDVDHLTMGQVKSAAQDPIFWLHHANIDRLWSCWNASGNKDLEFIDNGKKYTFVEPDGSLKEYSVNDMLNLVKKMDYKYDVASYKDCKSPLNEGLKPKVQNLKVINISSPYSINIKNESVQVPVQLDKLQNLQDIGIHSVELNLNNISSHYDMKGLYEVYVKSIKSNKEIFVGGISFFGFHNDGDHHDSSFSKTIDVTDAVNSLLRTKEEFNSFAIVVKPDSRLSKEEKATLSNEFNIKNIELNITLSK